MNYHSPNEYFYKFYARLFLLVLFPLAVFLFLYSGIQAGLFGNPLPIHESYAWMVRLFFPVLAVFHWVTGLVIFLNRLKSVRTIVSLGEKLDRYFSIVQSRTMFLVYGWLVLAAGYYLLQDQVVTIVFIAGLLSLIPVWPFPRRVCNDLRLKDDERRWVLEWK
jgi:hypothetical protein